MFFLILKITIFSVAPLSEIVNKTTIKSEQFEKDPSPSLRNRESDHFDLF